MNLIDTKTPGTGSGRIKEGIRVLYRKFIEPKSVREDDRRREYILNIVLVGSIVMLLLLDGVTLYYTIHLGSNDHGISFLHFSAIPAFFILLLVFSRRGYFIPASYLLIAAYFLSESYAVVRWTADMPPALLGYALTIMLASILVDTRLGFILTAIVGLFLVPTHYLQIHTLIASDASWKYNANTTDALVFTILLFLIMTVSWLSNREIERSLLRARTSEHELQRERDSLEVKVEERTQELQKEQFEKIEQINQFAKFGQLASGLFHDMLNIMNTLSVKIDLSGESGISTSAPSGNASDRTSAATKQIEQFMNAIRKQLGRQESNEEFSIPENIKQVIRLLDYKANKEGVRIAFEYEGANGKLKHFGNVFKFHQIMFNLILNAIESYEKMPRESGRERNVIVRATRTDDCVVVSVADRGCGIDENIREKIFNPFFSTKAEPKGMGIGLASVKKIVEEDYKGTIAAQANGNKGSVFTVKFALR